MSRKFETRIPDSLSILEFRLYLQSELARRCGANPQYSLRSFAMQLGINHSTLSQLLRGKRVMTTRMVESLGARLGLGPEEIHDFAERERQTDHRFLSNEIRLLTMDTVALLSDGSHRSILELTHMEGFRPDSRWIARTLDLTTDEVNMALSRLTRLGLLEMAAPDQWIDRSGVNAAIADRYGDGFAQQVIRRLSERVRSVSKPATERMGAAQSTGKGDAVEPPPIPATARIEINAAQLPVVMEFIDQLRREASDLKRDEKGYQVEINLAPTQINPRPRSRVKE
jgi:uncharacterized protein (TIGR02147 family)